MKWLRLIGVCVLISFSVMALFAGGQYLGGKLFARLQDLPDWVVSVHTLYDYWGAYGDARNVRLALAFATLVSVLIPLLPIATIAFALATKGPDRELYGSARFAKLYEIRKSGLLDEEEGRIKPGRRRYPGIIVGKLAEGKPGRPDYAPKYLTYVGQEFVLLAAPTRSGKGVAVVAPNLLTYTDSVVALDTKGELYDLTSGYRQTCGQQVFRWAPFDEEGFTHAWNPFEKIAQLPPHIRIGRLQILAARQYHTSDEKNRFFYESAADLFLGVALYLIETTGNCTFGEVLRTGVPIRPDVTLRMHVAEMMAWERDGQVLSGDCLGAFGRFLTAPDENLSGIAKTFATRLSLFANPIVDAATSRCDFRLDQVRRVPMTVYLVLPVAQMALAGTLANLFFTQWIEDNVDVLPEADPTLRYQCLGLLDEAAAVGKIDILVSATAFIAGYNIRLLSVFQSVSQGEDPAVYGQYGMSTVVKNHGAKVVFPPNDRKDAEEVSRTLGSFTTQATSKGRTRGRNTSSSENVSDHKRELMNVQELREMPQREQIVFVGSTKPISCEKAYFYEDILFIDRLRSVNPALTQWLGEVGEPRLPNELQMKDAQMSGLLRATGIEKIDIAKIHGERSARIAAAVRSSRQVGAKPLTAREQLELDATRPPASVIRRVGDALLDDLLEMGELVSDDLREMLSGLAQRNESVTPEDWLADPTNPPSGSRTEPADQNATAADTSMTLEAYHHG